MRIQHCKTFSPWMAMSLNYSGFVTVGCCSFAGKSDTFSTNGKIDLPKLWNTPLLQNLRTAFTQNNADKEGCEKCALLIREGSCPSIPENFQFDPLRNNTRQQVIDAQYNAAKSGKLFLEKPPVKIALCFSPVCNLRCIMCSQEFHHKNVEFQELSSKALLEHREWLSGIDVIEICGGEVFASKEAIKFIRAMAKDKQLRNCRLRIVSNGILLNRIIDDLMEFPRLSLHISLDGVGKTYEKIRVGGTWSKVDANVRKMAKLARSRQGWSFSTSAVLLSESVKDLPNLAKYCMDNQLELFLQELLPTRCSFPYDLENNPEIRSQIQWEEKLLEAHELFAKGNQPEPARITKIFLNKLRKAQFNKNQNGLVYDFKKIIASNNLKGKRVMIWGTGSNYRLFLADWLSEHKDSIQFLGFADNDQTRWEQTIDGFTIHSPQKTAELSPDIIILAVTLIWRETILEQIRKLKIQCIVV